MPYDFHFDLKLKKKNNLAHKIKTLSDTVIAPGSEKNKGWSKIQFGIAALVPTASEARRSRVNEREDVGEVFNSRLRWSL